MKFMVVFICVILVLYGFYGLTVRESIVFTFLGSAFQLFLLLLLECGL